MTREDDRIRALEFNYPEYIPVSMGILPRTWIKYRDVLEDIVLRHPLLFPEYRKGDRGFDDVSGTYIEGKHIDAWGCVWNNIAHGMESYVTHHPVPTRESVRKLKMPGKDEGIPHGFMYLRLAYLRGFEEIMMDFAEEPPELQMLIDIVLEYNMRQVENYLEERKNEKIIWFGDDLGMQTSLPVSPEKWRKYLKPCFAKIFSYVRSRGHYVYMHTDGHIHEIIPDLIECGVNIINPQFRANGLDNLVRVCKGRICVELDLDRQMFPFCTPAEIDAHIRGSVEKLGSPEGGLWLEAECAPDVPLVNVEALCTALEKYRSYYR